MLGKSSGCRIINPENNDYLWKGKLKFFTEKKKYFSLRKAVSFFFSVPTFYSWVYLKAFCIGAFPIFHCSFWCLRESVTPLLQRVTLAYCVQNTVPGLTSDMPTNVGEEQWMQNNKA